MILTCPECATRYQVDAAQFPPAGRNVRCAKCSHVWHQAGPEPEPPPEPAIAVPVRPSPPASPPPPRPTAFAPAPVIAPPVEEASASKSRWPMLLALSAGWIGLVGFVLVVGWAAVAYREQIAGLLPQSASLYAKMGLDANASGLKFDPATENHVDVQDGQTVLTITGRLINVSTHELPVPQIRVGLTDKDKRELYHWTFVPDAMTLAPGQGAPFHTRLSNPPPATAGIELRAVKAGE